MNNPIQNRVPGLPGGDDCCPQIDSSSCPTTSPMTTDPADITGSTTSPLGTTSSLNNQYGSGLGGGYGSRYGGMGGGYGGMGMGGMGGGMYGGMGGMGGMGGGMYGGGMYGMNGMNG